EAELAKAFHQIASVADILVGNEEDFQLCLGMKGPEAGGKDLGKKMAQFKGMIGEVKKSSPNAQVYATTLREVVSANEHNWGALVRVGDNWYEELPRPIQVMDRIGGGDGFVGGLLYAILSGKNEEDWIKFGWATGVLAATVLTDYSTPADEDQIWSVYKGNARVKR
ncbi:MAG: sugar kinase, partial [Spirochaetales bacterium]|nr:sugar kinase [Spirochaetales bacterium]